LLLHPGQRADYDTVEYANLDAILDPLIDPDIHPDPQRRGLRRPNRLRVRQLRRRRMLRNHL